MKEQALKVVLLVKDGCHLCEIVEAEIRSIRGVKTSLTMIDIDENQDLRDEFWLRVPVVTVDGKDVFEAKMMDTEGKWKTKLPALLIGKS